MKGLILLLLCVPTLLLAQQRYREALNQDPFMLVDPEPHKMTPHYDYLNTTGLKKVVLITTKKWYNPTQDTMNIEHYNKDGLKVQTIRYGKGIPESATQHFYDDRKNYISWELYSYKKPSRVTKVVFTYSANNKLIKTLNLELNENDTLVKTVTHLEYEKNMLVSLEAERGGQPYASRKITYENGKVTRATFKVVALTETAFTYNDKGLLVDVTEKMGESLYSSNTYEYDSFGRLIKHRRQTASNIADKSYQTTEYSYNPDGTVCYMYNTYKDYYQKINFEYANGKQKNLKIETNGESAYLKNFIPFTLSGQNHTYPLLYEEQWEYDNRGNVIKKKYYANSELFQELVFSVEYY